MYLQPTKIEGPARTFTSSGAIPKYSLVSTDTGAATVSVCGAGETPIGSVNVGCDASGEAVAVRLPNAPGTEILIASAAIAVGDRVKPAAGGKIVTDNAAGTYGTALTAATADGQYVEVLPGYLADQA
ncbi:capsid cement protein [Alienimonas sp. DA493]|uniref:capsid cement protein n=1 Tax=Alienimonas sp. DA493 TaxID=3373605 RepID=UPI003754BC4D